MTVIAYRDGILAADSSAWFGRAKHSWSRKLLRASDGTLYGICGQNSEGQAFFRWVTDGCQGESPMPRAVGQDEEMGSFGVLRITPDRIVSILTNPYGWEFYGKAPYYAMGGGENVALGALYAGASAETAVRAAIEHSGAASGQVNWIAIADGRRDG